MSLTCRRSYFVAGLIPLLLPAAVEAAATPAAPAGDEVVKLPEYTVTAERELPPPESWRYAQLPGLEILSNASDTATQRIVHDFRMFDAAMRVVWPVLERANVNVALILCGARSKFDDFVAADDTTTRTGTASLCLNGREQSAIVLDLQSRILDLLTLEQVTDTATPSAADDSESAGTGLAGFAIDHYKQLKREYIRLLLGRVEPRAPAWLEEGLVQLFMTMQVQRRNIVFAKIENPNIGTLAQVLAPVSADTEALPAEAAAPEEDDDFNRVLRRRGIIPFDEFFAVQHDSPQVRNSLGGTWAKQAQGFVHMCLYGRGGRFQKGFITFVARLAREPLSEELFKECFGHDYKWMQTELRAYVEFTDHKHQEFRSKGEGLPEIPPLELREATEAEVGRIKGDALLLAHNPSAARATLVAAYMRGEREPTLLASLGLAEKTAGNVERATELLEAACAAKVERPLAYIELARLRLAAFAATPARDDGRLTPGQVAQVMQPLFTARSLRPLLPEVYDLIAEAWERSAAAPSRDHLAVLDEGVRAFPRRGALILQAARLNARHGFTAEAKALVEFGLRAVRDPQLRQEMSALQATLP